MSSPQEARLLRDQPWAVFAGGAVIGLLGGLIGLGGAEFRLPLLIAVFGFVALEAVILNKAMSLCLANYSSSGDGCMKQARTVGSPDEVTQIGASGCVHAAALCGRATTERGMNAPLIVVDGKSFQLPLQVQTIPDYDPIEVFPSHRAYKPLDERVRARNGGD